MLNKSAFLRRFIFLSIILVILPIMRTQFKYKEYSFEKINDLPETKVALVLGAAIWGKNIPSHALEDRITTAVELYKANKVEKLLMSGDNRSVNYNEPQTMKNVAVSMGIPEKDIILDFAGLRTYDSCYRFKEIFQQEQAIIVTQAFHLPRALYICNELGIKTVGIKADKRSLLKEEYFFIRELAASLKAFFEVNVTKPEPKFLGAIENIN